MQAVQRSRVTEDEYLERERRAATKSELLHGEIVAMAGGSPRHNALSANVIAALRQRLRERGAPCVVFTSDQRIAVEATGLYTYPDVTVACGPARFHTNHRDTLVSPTVIVEVLSRSTEGYDRGAKFAHYRSVDSVAEYVLVSQETRRVEHFRRLETGQWLLTVHEGDAAELELPAPGCVIPLAEIYEQTEGLTPDEAGGDG